MIYLQVGGDPIPWKRVGINLKTGAMYDRQHAEKEQYRWVFRDQYKKEPVTCSLKAKIIFKLPVPAGTSRVKRSQMCAGMIPPNKKPDLDNLQKFVLDAMNGLIYRDDSQICEMTAIKTYSDTPGVDISLTPILEEVKPAPKARSKKIMWTEEEWAEKDEKAKKLIFFSKLNNNETQHK
jgi:Holliday junction resolvase RusA-like endonuclease